MDDIKSLNNQDTRNNNQKITNNQKSDNQKVIAFGFLNIDYWNFFGYCFLVIGIFVRLTWIPSLLFANDIPPELDALSSEVHQAVVVEAAAGTVTATVSGWERKDGSWRQALAPVEAVIGRNGLAPSGEKREGDGRTPSGVFELRRAFGYEENVPTGLDYRRVSEKDVWVDAPSSLFYNQWMTVDVPPPVSHEVLRRLDDLYKYAIVIEYNTDPVLPGMGSAIFMHVWRAPGEPTAGCVAMAQDDLRAFLRWLDVGRNPVVSLQGDVHGI